MSKGGRVMVDVKRGILEGYMPVRGTADGVRLQKPYKIVQTGKGPVWQFHFVRAFFRI
jgi:hypothetical protein